MAEPPFVPKPGQTDYTDIRYAPVINSVITRDGKILLVQRSSGMRLYPDYWSGISGFLDDAKDIEEKVYEELREELQVKKTGVESIQIGQVLLQEAPEYHKTWLVVPVLVRLTTTAFTLDWEAQRAQWFKPHELTDLELLPGFDKVVDQFRKVIY